MPVPGGRGAVVQQAKFRTGGAKREAVQDAQVAKNQPPKRYSSTAAGIYERVGFSSDEAVLLSHIWEAFLTNPTTGEPLRCYTSELTNMRIIISLRDENGDVLLARQVSTQPAKIHAFFQQLTRQRLAHDESFAAVLEVCGFNEWLIRMLKDYRCHKVILIQPEERKKQKMDRRDAAWLSELLWVNRARLLQGKPVRGLRQVDISSTTDQENRRLTTLRKSAGQAQTRIILKIKHMLRSLQSAVGNADEDVSYATGHCLAEEAGLARDRSLGDGSLAG